MAVASGFGLSRRTLLKLGALASAAAALPAAAGKSRDAGSGGQHAVDLAATSTDDGVWVLNQDGSIDAYGDAQDYTASPVPPSAPSLPSSARSLPFVGLAATSTDEGLWALRQDGSIVAYGDAQDFTASNPFPQSARTQPFVDLAATSTDGGLWVLSRDGTIISHGDAKSKGGIAVDDILLTIRSREDSRSYNARAPSQPFTALVATSTDEGLWVMDQDGGIVAGGDAQDFTASNPLPQSARTLPFTGMAATSTDGGLWTLRQDGRIFSHGDAKSKGGIAVDDILATIRERESGGEYKASPSRWQSAGMAATATDEGLWVLGRDGRLVAGGDAEAFVAEPSQAADGNYHSYTVCSVDTDTNSFVADRDGDCDPFGDGRLRFFYKSVDTFIVNRTVITMADFEAAISPGDRITVDPYSNLKESSTFVLQDLT